MNKAGASVTVNCPKDPQPYTGSAQTPCTAGYTTSDGLSGSLVPAYSNNQNVGTATANASYAGDANHEAAGNSASFEISKADSSVTVTGTTSFTYTGLPQGPDTASVTGSTGAVTYSYVGTGKTTYGPSAVKPTEPGTYTVIATVAADANYNSASSSPTVFTIGKFAPTVTTQEATDVTPVSVTLNATVNANSLITSITFEYGLTTGYGSTITAAQSPVSGAVDTAVSAPLTHLTSNTTYHFRAVAVNEGGTTQGADQTFTTTVAPPVATTNAANVMIAGATLTGTVNASNASTTVTFEYGETTSYGSTVTAAQSPVDGIQDTAVSAAIFGLTAHKSYHFRVVAVNSGGTTYGADQTFTTGEYQIFLPSIRVP
jgi:hypothetical protein